MGISQHSVAMRLYGCCCADINAPSKKTLEKTACHLLRCKFAHWQNVCERAPQFMSSDQATELYSSGMAALLAFLMASAEAVRQSRFAFLCIPKLHIFQHLLMECLASRYNCRHFHNFSGESFMGSLKTAAQSCAGLHFESRLLKRSLLRVMASRRIEIHELAR